MLEKAAFYFMQNNVQPYIYSLHSVFLPQDLFKPPKIAIVDQPCFILMVIQGSYTYF